MPVRRRRWCRWSPPRSRSRARAGRRSGAASSCSSGSPPVQTTRRGSPAPPRHSGRDAVGQGLGVGELAAARAVHADEIGVAEGADGRGAVLLAPAPQVAAGEAQNTAGRPAWPPSPCSGEEDFLDGVGHAPPGRPLGRSPAARSSQAGQVAAAVAPGVAVRRGRRDSRCGCPRRSARPAARRPARWPAPRSRPWSARISGVSMRNGLLHAEVQRLLPWRPWCRGGSRDSRRSRSRTCRPPAPAARAGRPARRRR